MHTVLLGGIGDLCATCHMHTALLGEIGDLCATCDKGSHPISVDQSFP